MKIIDIIEMFIPGDWGEEALSEEATCKVSCIRGADIIPIANNDFSNIPTRYISQRAFESKCLQAGDIIVEKSGGSPIQSTGRVAMVSQDLIDTVGCVVCSNFCVAFRVKQKWNPLYIYYYLQHVYNCGVFFNFEGKTSGIKNLQLEAAYNAIPIEDVDETTQNSVVAILDNIQEKIVLNHAINQNLEALAKQIFDYWFVQFDFPNEEGKPYKSSGGKMVWDEKLKREIPEGWDVLAFDDLFEIGNGRKTPQSDGYIPAYGGNGVVKYIGESNYESCFIIGRVGANCGSLHYSPAKCWVSDNAISATPKKKNDTAYLLNSLRLYDLSRGKGGSSQPLITHNSLKCLSFPYSSKYVSAYSNIVTKQLSLYYKNELEISNLTKQRDELLPLLMNGQVTVE